MASGTDELAPRWRPRSAQWTPSEAVSGALLLATVLIAGAVWRLWFAAADDSLYWPDEFHQSLEPAHGLVFGYAFQAWEFDDGARSWFFPSVLAGVLWTLDALGLNTPAEYMPAFEVLFCAVGVLTAWGCAALARSLGASAPAAAAAAGVFALAAPLIYFAPRALGETASAAPIVWAFALALRPGAGRRALGWAAVLLSAAVLLRLQNGLFCLGLLAILAGQRRWEDLRFTFLGLCVGAAYFGLLDWITWGRPFHSAMVYLKFNLIDGKASLFGTAPWFYYLQVFSTAMPVLAAITAGLFIVGLRRAPGLSVTALIAMLSLWAIPHKEFRFVVPFVPLICAVAALGLDRVGATASRWGGASTLAAVLTAAALASAAQTPRLTFEELGQTSAWRPAGTPALDHDGATNRLLSVAGLQPDLCGLRLADTELVWSGGYTRFHRNASLLPEGAIGGPYNYLITTRGAGLGEAGRAGRVVAADGETVLIRLDGHRCPNGPAPLDD